MIIAIDFDGTCVSHEFPKVGNDISAVPVLKELVAKGHKLILFTMRSNSFYHTGASDEVPELHKGEFLNDAVKWFVDNDIPLYGIQSNPTQSEWTESPKAYAQLYIDDAALGCPLKYDLKVSKRDFVDWVKVRELLVANNYL